LKQTTTSTAHNLKTMSYTKTMKHIFTRTITRTTRTTTTVLQTKMFSI